MIIKKEKFSGIEKRRYIRLKSVFPVEFQVLDPKTNTTITKWKQGFTNNIGKGGLCLSVNNLEDDIAKYLVTKDTILSLNVNIPLNWKPIHTTAKIVWSKKIQDQPINQYLIGLMYTDIEQASLRRIMRYTRWMQFTTQLSVYFIVTLVLIISAMSFYNFKLRIENRRLVNNFVAILQKDSLTKGQLKTIQDEKAQSEKNLSEYKEKIYSLETQLSQTQKKLDKELMEGQAKKASIEASKQTIKKFQESIAQLNLQQNQLKDELARLSIKEDSITQELGEIEKTKIVLEEATIKKMYQWLKIHQNPRTGLVLSFEGDIGLNQWAFTYDQALVAQIYTIFGDREKAKSIFNFFNDRIKKINKFNGFYNAYYADAGDVTEYIVHCGPNIWLGIAVLQYINLTGDSQYLPLAIKIADWLISLQGQDSEGGIRGGPDVYWFATEHNLDAFAFFKMLYKITKVEKYELASKKILNWLNAHAYDRQEPPIKRGKGDATIATDTYAWSIAAVGPGILKSLGMNPDEILEFAVENCEVTVNYKRPNGQIIQVTGFDFAKYRNLPRGGVVSSEWTAQMIMAFKIMSRFYHQQNNTRKAKEYQHTAERYLNELGKLIISSSSPTGQGEGCLPYATIENADTGHGWRTPFGNKTGSIAGTAYTIFAYRDYNPLEM